VIPWPGGRELQYLGNGDPMARWKGVTWETVIPWPAGKEVTWETVIPWPVGKGRVDMTQLSGARLQAVQAHCKQKKSICRFLISVKVFNEDRKRISMCKNIFLKILPVERFS
jgi:hypothetical protein